MGSTLELPLPTLLGITQAPVFSASGTLSTTPGYQAETRHFLHLGHGVVINSISEQVQDSDLAKARSLVVDELLHDFPFVQDADLAHAVTIFLLPFVRLLIDGPTPLHLVESPTPGTGKGLLVDVLTTPMLGHGPPIMTEGRDEDEWRKRITAKLLEGPQYVFFDNVRSRLDSSALSAALTSPIWEDRILGLSKTAVQPVTCVWIATANNPGLSLEVARRTVSVRLDRGVEKPWKEQDFKHPKLRDWARQHRGELIWSALTLVQGWIAEGRPSGDAILGTYESYAEVVGGILQVAGIPGFLGNTDRVYAEADRETSEWVEFCAAWWGEFSETSLGADQLFGLATRQQLLLEVYGGRNDRSGRTRFGLALSKMRDRVVGEFRIRSADPDSHTKTARYRLEVRELRDVAGRLGPHDSSSAIGPSNDDEAEPSSIDLLTENSGGQKVPQPPATSRNKPGDIWEEEL